MDKLSVYSVLYILGAYLLGCINAAYIYAKAVKNTDIRDYSSGNAGATNVLRIYGAKAAIPVFLFDACKGFVACKLSMVFFPGAYWITLLACFAVIAGHNWPVFLQYRGGKGVAASVGIGLALNPLFLGVSLGLALIIIAITKYVSLGSLLGIGTYFVLTLLFIDNLYIKIIAAMLFALTIYGHRTNIQRLLQGKENKIGSSKAK